MASATAGEQLECSICLSIFTDPVMLRCGHNYCRVCIDRVLDTQERSGGYSCPECRDEFQDRPALQRNIFLRNIVESFLSAQPDLYESGVFCTYCFHAAVPAVRSCLLCEASLCDNHLRVHSKAPEHVLCDPTTSLQIRKCSIHKKILEYFCIQDSVCICVSCCMTGKHQGHQTESLDKVSEKKKKKLRNDLQKLNIKRNAMESRVRSLQERRRKVEEKKDGETKKVTVLFRDLRRRLEDQERRVLREISGQAERVSLSLNDLIHQLEIKKDELSRRMRHIEELCNMTDPLTVLQEADTGDLCDTKDEGFEDREREDNLLHDGEDLDMAAISHTLLTGFSDIVTEVKVCFSMDKPANLSLNVNTACNKLHISDDMKTASCLPNQNRPETPQRFKVYPQVISSQSFSLGRHYWEVDVGESQWWRLGVCYPSIDRKGVQSWIGYNQKSWGLYRFHGQYWAIHDSQEIQLQDSISCDRVRIYLDYEAGKIFFWAMCDPIRHLHTFTATFSEPLHAAFGVWKGCVKISG
ncbi:PREDICTED: E3 ubiquitin/ISG15 ligase TRIM25-like [Nanorana parkeri]|uniref:E3 ubiquitin/ISG15 ligase TRIM25-like n=1 Tax=Nanorana parkeri TaxID=125878 RepID=UPI0008540C2B|nr:PREDICTED: E3 ubiquitin/ISG15 ligase TRIM25-like [Nanorana parkeri]